MPTPIPTPQAVSKSLDGLGTTIGGIIVRGPDGWLVLAPGPLGYVLTSNGPNTLPSWEPPI